MESESERYNLLAKEYEGVMKSEAKLKRSAERRGQHLLGMLDKNGRMAHELRRLENLLVWIHRTGQPLDEIRRVIERTVPRSIRRGDPGDPRALRVAIEPDDLDGGFVASVEELPGCASQGETQAAALRNIADALEGVSEAAQKTIRSSLS